MDKPHGEVSTNQPITYMQIPTTAIWSVINRKNHPKRPEEFSTTFLIAVLFPGINYYSLSGASQAMNNLAIPALRKLFPELEGMSEDEVVETETREVTVFLKSKGYEWQDSQRWTRKFEKLIAA